MVRRAIKKEAQIEVEMELPDTRACKKATCEDEEMMDTTSSASNETVVDGTSKEHAYACDLGKASTHHGL